MYARSFNLYSHPLTIFSETDFRTSSGILSTSCSPAGNPGCGPNPGSSPISPYSFSGLTFVKTFLANAVRCAFSSGVRFSTPIPRDLRAVFDIPDASALVGSAPRASRTNSSFSIRPNVPLHRAQLGTVHLCTWLGVVSGYHEVGNTWSLVFSLSSIKQWTHFMAVVNPARSWKCSKGRSER